MGNPIRRQTHKPPTPPSPPKGAKKARHNPPRSAARPLSQRKAMQSMNGRAAPPHPRPSKRASIAHTVMTMPQKPGPNLTALESYNPNFTFTATAECGDEIAHPPSPSKQLRDEQQVHSGRRGTKPDLFERSRTPSQHGRLIPPSHTSTPKFGIPSLSYNENNPPPVDIGPELRAIPVVALTDLDDTPFLNAAQAIRPELPTFTHSIDTTTPPARINYAPQPGPLFDGDLFTHHHTPASYISAIEHLDATSNVLPSHREGFFKWRFLQGLRGAALTWYQDVFEEGEVVEGKDMREQFLRRFECVKSYPLLSGDVPRSTGQGNTEQSLPCRAVDERLSPVAGTAMDNCQAPNWALVAGRLQHASTLTSSTLLQGPKEDTRTYLLRARAIHRSSTASAQYDIRQRMIAGLQPCTRRWAVLNQLEKRGWVTGQGWLEEGAGFGDIGEAVEAVLRDEAREAMRARILEMRQEEGEMVGGFLGRVRGMEAEVVRVDERDGELGDMLVLRALAGLRDREARWRARVWLRVEGLVDGRGVLGRRVSLVDVVRAVGVCEELEELEDGEGWEEGLGEGGLSAGLGRTRAAAQARGQGQGQTQREAQGEAQGQATVGVKVERRQVSGESTDSGYGGGRRRGT